MPHQCHLRKYLVCLKQDPGELDLSWTTPLGLSSSSLLSCHPRRVSQRLPFCGNVTPTKGWFTPFGNLHVAPGAHSAQVSRPPHWLDLLGLKQRPSAPAAHEHYLGTVLKMLVPGLYLQRFCLHGSGKAPGQYALPPFPRWSVARLGWAARLPHRRALARTQVPFFLPGGPRSPTAWKFHSRSSGPIRMPVSLTSPPRSPRGTWNFPRPGQSST